MSEFKCDTHKDGRLYVDRPLRAGAGGAVRVCIKGEANSSITVAANHAVPLARAILDCSGADAVVLDGPFPQAEPEDGGLKVQSAWYPPQDASQHLHMARRRVAAARYLDQHPPVDPEVERLAELIRSIDDTAGDYADLAKHLIAAGVRVTNEAQR